MSDKRDTLLVTAGLAFFFGLTSGIAVSAATNVLLKLLKPIAARPSTASAQASSRDLPPTSPRDYQFPILSASQPAKDSALQRLEKMFTIPTTKLHEIVKYFVREMQRGLSAEGQTLKMIPSYVNRRATGAETGVYLALDLGGSNFRVCEVFLEGKGQVRMKQKKYVVSDALKTGDGKELFDFFASSIREFYEENSIQKDSFRRLGFTFSFPCTQTSIDKGFLIQWTKGFTAKGVEGQDIAKLLQEALARQGLSIHVSAIVNDTVGALIAHSYADPMTFVGVILGTGSNAAYVERIDQIPKWTGPRPASGEMVINMEWGAFDNEGLILPRTPYDARLDRESAHPREQRFEKMISGMYLGEITRLVISDWISTGELFAGKTSTLLETANSFDTANMSRIERDHSLELSDTKTVLEDLFQIPATTLEDRRLVKRICELIGTRAARLSAAGIAAIVTKINRLDDCTVAVDGSLFLHYPHFANRMRDALRELVGITADNLNLVQARDGSGQGAALIAALAGDD